MNKSKKKLLNKKHKKTYKKKLLKQKIKSITKHKNKKQLHKKTKTKSKNRIKGGTKEDDIFILFTSIVIGIQNNNLETVKENLAKNPAIINYQLGEEKTNLLEQAILYDKPDIVNFLLDNGANINLVDKGESTPLIVAILQNNNDSANILIEKGANLNMKDIFGRTALHLAAQKKNRYILQKLLEKKTEIDIEPKDSVNVTPLSYAGTFGDVECVRLLLDSGANINSKDINSWTPLFYAVEYGKMDAAKLLIDRGANILEKNKFGNTPLHVACKRGNLDMVKLLLENGSLKGINDQDNKGLTALMYAVSSENLDIVKLLLEYCADIKNLKNSNNKTALDLAEDGKNTSKNNKIYDLLKDTDKLRYQLIQAVARGDLNAAQSLINQGVPINIKNTNGDNLLQTACFKPKDFDMVNLLLNNGAGEFINNQNKVGTTALTYAVLQNNLPLVKLLLENGAIEGINDQDFNGSTALIYAALDDNLDIVTLLLEKGANIFLKNNDGYTALGVSTKSSEVNTLLTAKGKEIIQKNILVRNQTNEEKQVDKKDKILSDLKKNEEKQEDIQSLISKINADLLIEEEEKLTAKKLAQKNKKLLAKKRRNEERTQKEILENQMKREKEESERSAREIESFSKEENYQKEQQLYLQELKNKEELERILQEKEEKEANELLEKQIQEAIEESKKTYNFETLQLEVIVFWTKYFGSEENIKKIKTEIVNMELLKDNNSFEKLKQILPAYSNKFIIKDQPSINDLFTNNTISLLFILIGILTNVLIEKGIYLMLKGGSAIQNVGSQVPTQFMVPYESNDIDIVLINTNNINNPDENKILAEQIANFLIWVTQENSKSILTQTPNIDTTHPIVKIILNKNQKPLVDLDYNILPDDIYNLYVTDMYIKSFVLGQMSGLFYSPSINSLIYERIYLMINYSTREAVKVGKNIKFLTEKIPRSLNYLVKVLFVLENNREISEEDELKTFYGKLFVETFNFFNYSKEFFAATHNYEIADLIQMCINQLPAMRTTFYNSKED